MSERKLENWLSSYMEFTENSESPTSYHLWTGISCIAAALQRKVWMRWGHTTIYPNFYTVLVGPSGRARKGEPIDIGRGIIDEINISTIGDDNTQEAVIRLMKKSEKSFSTKDGQPHYQSAVSCFTEELAVLTGYQNGTFLAYLTQWYDSRDKWSRFTKHQGIDKLVGVCFNLLASTAPDWLPHILTREAIGGGFTSRIIFIAEEGKKQTITDPNEFPPDMDLRNSLVHDLEIIHTLCGEIKFDNEAKDVYKKWYWEQDQMVKRGELILPEAVFGGYISRRATHIKKICMAISMARGNSMVITLEHFEEALNLLTKAEMKMSSVFKGIGRAKYTEEMNLVLKLIKTRGSVLRSEILSILHRDVDMTALREITETLVGMNAIKAPRREGTMDFLYEMKDS